MQSLSMNLIRSADGNESGLPGKVTGARGNGGVWWMSAILLVDDHPAVRNGVGDVLRDAGYKVSEAGSGSEALTLLERSAFDLLIVDYLLPEMKGDAIARLARQRWPALRIAFLSGYAEFLSLTGKAGADTLIPKPISSDDLCKAVAGVLREPRALSRAA
jgi:CheY-like chemotaxis protein